MLREELTVIIRFVITYCEDELMMLTVAHLHPRQISNVYRLLMETTLINCYLLYILIRILSNISHLNALLRLTVLVSIL